MTAPTVSSAAGSHVGRVRATNEDRVYADPDRGSFAVIDGVGGQAAGELAAQTALETIRQRLQIQIGTPAERVREAIALANDHIHQQALARADLHGMACVLTLVLLQNGTLTAGHVGDTRLYKMRGGTLRKLTHDHSPIGEREDRGELTENDAMRHPRRNEVYREVGTEPHGPDDPGFIEVIEEPFEADAALVLCSDGLSDALATAAIAASIERHAGDPERVVDDLIARANDAGGKDNVSVVYVEGMSFAAEMRRLRPQPAGPATASAAATAATAAAAVTGTAATAAGRSATDAELLAAVVRGGKPPVAGQSTRSASGQATGSASGQATGSAAGQAAGSPRRILSFVIGLLIGVAIALGVAYTMRDVLMPPVEDPTPDPRVLTVGNVPATRANDIGGAAGGQAGSQTSGASASRPGGLSSGGGAGEGTTGSAAGATANTSFGTIGEALAEARPGDVIRVGPGEYREQLVISDGVSVIATPAREAILRAPEQALQPWTAVIVTGERHGTRVSGLRIAGDAQHPVAIGVHVLGRTVLDDLDISGTTIAGIAFENGALSLSASSVHTNAGPGLTLKGGEARLVHNVFARNGSGSLTGGTAPPPTAPAPAAAATGPDVVLADTPRVTFVGNVIGGDPAQRLRGLPADQIARFRDTNIVLPPINASRPAPARPPRRTPDR